MTNRNFVFKEGISIIVCCYNSVERLRPTLYHIAHQIVAPDISWEVIIVDNNSSDDTGKFAQEIWDSFKVSVPFKVVLESEPGLMHARNRGLDESGFSYLIFADDDNSLNYNYVNVVHEIFTTNSSVAVCNGDSFAEIPKDFDLPFWWNDFKSGYAVGIQGTKEGILPSNKHFLWGAGISFRKKALIEMYQGGFQNYLTGRKGKSLTAGEDSEICIGLLLLNYELYYSPRLSLIHHIPLDRINREYLEKQRIGFASCAAILSIYKQVLKKKRQNRFIIYLGHCFLMIIKSHVFYILAPEKCEVKRLKQYFLLKESKELFFSTFFLGRKKYNEIRNTAMNLKRLNR